MTPPIIAIDNSTEFELAPNGLHAGVCVDVVDLGNVTTQYGTKHFVQIRWQVQVDDDDIPPDKRFEVRRRFPLSLHPMSALRPFLESWRGKQFTEEEAKGFDLERLIGVNCQVQVLQEENNGRTYANVKTVVPVPKGQQSRLNPQDYTREKDRVKREPLYDNDDDGASF
jgi:hypothetical protein